MTNSKEYQQGKEAYKKGLFTQNNPYKSHTPEHKRWFQGFMSGYSTGRPVR